MTNFYHLKFCEIFARIFSYKGVRRAFEGPPLAPKTAAALETPL
jgi:hypothetical protein